MLQDDDPVVQEIPVYLSQTLADNLFLFQYPTRHMAIGYDNANIIQSCIKPVHQEVKLEAELDTSSPNYDTSKGEQIALNVDGLDKSPKKHDKKQEDETHFMGKIMDKQVLQSTKAVKDSSHYAVAILHENEFHLTPLRGIVHLRPSFGYLDKADKRSTEKAKDIADGETEEEEEEAKQVTVKFARQENERIKRARERSFGYLSKKSAEEPWYHTQFYSSQSEKAELERTRLYCQTGIGGIASQLTLGKEEYAAYLLPPVSHHVKQELKSTDIIPLAELKQLPLLIRVRHLLYHAKVMPFSQLAQVLNHGNDLAGLLCTVQQIAVLVRGNWVIRSDILYPKGTFSGISGISADTMCLGRDYILYKFTQQRFLDQISVAKVVKLPAEEVKEMLSQVAKIRPKRGWELLRPSDNDFISRYPEVHQRQQMTWEARKKQLIESFGDGVTFSIEENYNRQNSVRDSDSDSGLLGSPTNNSTRRKKQVTPGSDSGNCKIPRANTDIPQIKVKVEPMET